MHTTYGMDTCIETNEILAFGMEVYSRYIPDICKNLEYVRHIPDICLTYDTIRIPDDSFSPSGWNGECIAASAASRSGDPATVPHSGTRVSLPSHWSLRDQRLRR